MTSIITASLLILFFLGFVFNSTNLSLNLLKNENQFLQKRAQQYLQQSDSLLMANLEDLKIGELE